MTAMAATVMPGITLRQVMWEIPLVSVSYMIVQAMRRVGVQGIGRMDQAAKLWRRFSQLHQDELAEERRRKKITKK